MDQCSTDMQAEAQKPQDQKNNQNCPKHGNLPLHREVNLILVCTDNPGAQTKERSKPNQNRSQRWITNSASPIQQVLFLIVGFVVRLVFLYDSLDLGTVNFRKERLSYGRHWYLARQ